MDAVSKQTATIHDDIAQTVAMNPNLTIDELNLVVQRKAEEQNKCPMKDFCGLSPAQMANWMYSPFAELEWVEITTPKDLSGSPVMRYLQLLIDTIESHGGALKATAKGNLPLKVVKQASAFLSEFTVGEMDRHMSLSEFAGNKEDAFNVLHYTRVLAELCGIIYQRKGHFHLKKTQSQKYKKGGVSVFFAVMLEAAVKQYNWGYLDHFQEDVPLETFWLFMLWRLYCHGDVVMLHEEVRIAFPDLSKQVRESVYMPADKMLEAMTECRFIRRFLQYWGFGVITKELFSPEGNKPPQFSARPLLKQTFRFLV